MTPPVVVAGGLLLMEPSSGTAAFWVLAAGGASLGATLRLVVQPLRDALGAERKSLVAAEQELSTQRAELDVRSRLARALDATTNEGEALRIGLRAIAEAAPGSDITLLLSLPDGPRVGWRVDLVGGEPGAAVPLPGTPACAALASGATVTTTTGALEACAHIDHHQHESCVACVPLGSGAGTIGVVSLVTAPGEPLSVRSLDQVAWIAEQTARHCGRHRRREGTSLTEQPDALTGLPARPALTAHLRELVRSLTPFCLALVRVDRFDELDDDSDADAAAVTAAQALVETVRPVDFISRIESGGFAVILPDCTAAQAVAVMERLRENLVLLLTDGHTPLITCSSGVVESRAAGSLEEVIELASEACDEAGEAGGNRVWVWSERASNT
jgi:diguanylate cyclase (GGDEF)-like protein